MENILSPWRALNKAFLRLNPSWQEITPWRDNLLNLLQNIHEGETEEFHKNLIRDFLQKTYYQNDHFINTKDRCDLVVHMGKDTNSPVGLILECKSPTNKAEMPKPDQLNVKGLQQLLLYFLKERINQKNFELKHLIVTNCYEWFVFDAQEFERLFIQNQALVKQFKDFDTNRSISNRTDFFYENIAGPAIENILSELKFTYWDLRNYQAVIEKATPDQELTAEEQRDLVALFKIFSPEHLLKLPFANDSNTLNREFYNELLHIIGLTETKHGNKKLIERLPANERNPGSLLEGAIREIENLGKLSCLSNPERYGNTAEEQLFNVALELVITWVNRILFLKLLEAQLIRYHQGDRTFAFLNISKLEGFSDLNQLFFSILARQIEDRPAQIKDKFNHVPYLNSSLFEPTDLEMNIIAISNLNGTSLIFPQTILKDSQGNRLTGKLKTLQYLFEFLDAYDFGSDGVAGIREKSKSLINAAVLGLIFEKINGYQDGSFYTPGFITMYMCRETIRRAVVQKFNEVKGWNCHNFADLQEELVKYIRLSSDRIIPRNEANQIINSLKICDPAVGSGHFLVSALNEIIVVKQELEILQDKNGRILVQYEIHVENDELIITNLEYDIFEYNPKNKESQRVQETIFHEKQTLIENCLFGVDININSVKICQLRLWIELLKNAYYKADNQLETLPNIDINIKHGNSLISRFGIDADLKSILIARKNKSDIADYRNATHAYFQATSKEEKNQAKKTIAEIKQKIQNSLQSVSHERSKLKKLEQELFDLENQPSLFEASKTEKKTKEKKIVKLNNEIDKLKVAIEEEESGLLYANALEWRFEFPEVLNDDGDFIGFDIVIGNPPYGVQLSQSQQILLNNIYNFGTTETAILFILKGYEILKNHNGFQSFIIPKAYTYASNYAKMRNQNLSELQLVVDCGKVWQDVKLEQCIFLLAKNHHSDSYLSAKITNNQVYSLGNIEKTLCQEFDFLLNGITEAEINLAQKIKNNSLSLNDLVHNQRGGMFQKKVSETGTVKVIGGAELARYRPKSKIKGKISQQDLKLLDDQCFIKNNTVLVQNIVAHIENPIDHIKIISAIVDDPTDLIILDTINQLIPKVDHVSHRYIMALLNSQLINWYAYRFIFGKAIRTMHFDNTTTNKIPFPKAPQAQIIDQIESLITEILTIKKTDPNTDTTQLEKSIDHQVYQLYGLTAAEIAIVENHHP